jgi:hypothetical protein
MFLDAILNGIPCLHEVYTAKDKQNTQHLQVVAARQRSAVGPPSATSTWTLCLAIRVLMCVTPSSRWRDSRTMPAQWSDPMPGTVSRVSAVVCFVSEVLIFASCVFRIRSLASQVPTHKDENKQQDNTADDGRNFYVHSRLLSQ